MASFCFLSHQKSALRLLNRGQKMTQVIDKLARNLNNEWSAKFVLDQPILFAYMCYKPKKDHI